MVRTPTESSHGLPSVTICVLISSSRKDNSHTRLGLSKDALHWGSMFDPQFSYFSRSTVWLFETPWTTARQACLSITNSWSLLNSCPLSQWCHPTISSSVIPFSVCSQSFPASGSFQMSQVSESGGQSIGVSASASVLPMNTQDWFPLG